MTKIVFIGDVHANIWSYLGILDRYRDTRTIQVGDMGVGFPGVKLPDLPKNHEWFAGNHDNPDLCLKHPNCLGRFGFKDGVFFVSGAASIDAADRIPGFSWWAGEELSQPEMDECLQLYSDLKPDIVASHDGPPVFTFNHLLPEDGLIFNNRTSKLLHEMWKIHAPKYWICGHWHHSKEIKIGETLFKCLAELQVMELNL